MRLTATSLILVALLGCKEDVGLNDGTGDAVDERVDWTTDRAEAIAFYTPDYVVAPYSDQTMCYFDSYEGGEVGVVWAGFYQNQAFGHHVVLMASTADEDDWPDGTVADCTTTDADIMVEARPFLFPGEVGTGQPVMELPPTMGVKLKAGQRFVVQSHHINTGPDPVKVNDAVFLDTVATTEIETWAAPWVHTQTDLNLPKGPSSEVVDCAFDTDLHILSMLGHMHEWGASYTIDHMPLAGPETRIYDIPDWDVQFRDAPPTDTFAVGAFEVKAGDRFVTTCSWDNDTDGPLTFPHEMCATVGFAYPLVVPAICEP